MLCADRSRAPWLTRTSGLGCFLLFLVLAASDPASAQFVCTTTATETTCTNSGTAPASQSTVEVNKSATTINSGSVNGDIQSVTTNGNAATANSGSVNGDVEAVTTNGNATATNSGSANGDVEAVTTNGNAAAANSGSANGDVQAVTTNGNAAAANSGSANGDVEAVTSNGNATATNSGSANGDIQAVTTNGDATATNSGSANGDVQAVTSNGNATATNSGSANGDIQAVTTNGNATATNSGSANGDLQAVTSNGNATATNFGSVNGDVQAVTTNGNATAANLGSAKGDVQAVTTNGNATVTNSGSATGQVQAVTTNGNATVNNSGTAASGVDVISTTGAATLNLLAGSRIIGDINVVGASQIVNFVSGNHNLTFNSLAGTTVTGAIPFAVSGNQAAAVDPTPFAMTERLLMDFSRTVSSSIPVIDGRPGIAPALTGYADTGDSANNRVADVFANIPGMSDYAADTAVYKSPTAAYRDGTVLWARGFVGQRLQKTDGAVLHNFNQFYGGMIGGDWQARADLRVGAFIGGGHTRSTTDFTVGDTTSDLVFGGAYARYVWGNSFLHGVVQVGHSNSDTTRTINNNLLPNGLEFAKASYSGWYVSPELTYGVHYGLPSLDGAVYTLTPSVQVRYLYASFDGYTESGTTTAPLTVGTRTLGDFEERGQLKLTRTISGRTETLATSVYGGILGVQRVGDSTIAGVLLGQAIPFATPGDDTVWAGFGGAEVALRTGNIAFFLGGEYYAFSDSSNVASARGGIRLSF